jgi:hypothetical protein
MICESCGRSIAGSYCSVCSPRRIHFKRSLAICGTNTCGHLVECSSGAIGCGHLQKPCRIANHLLAGGGCLNEPPLFDSSEKSLPRKPLINLSHFIASPSPLADETSLVTFHYNPAKFHRLRETYYKWLPSLGPLAKSLRCYELVYDDDEPEINGSIVIRGTREKNTLWQKEAIINLALRETPPHIKYFAWLDHDFVLSNPDWLSQAIEKIDAGSVAVQLFHQTDYLDINQRIERTRYGGIMRWQKNKSLDANPGGAWIADRAFMDAIGGVNALNICGGGDQTWMDAMRGHIGYHMQEYSDALADSLRQWVEGVWAVMGERTADYLPVKAYHIYHGDMSNRQYKSRNIALQDHRFDPQADVRIGDNGLLEWCSDKPELHAELRKFFANRREDG